MADGSRDQAFTATWDNRRGAHPLGWYADAFSVDRNCCWRYITRGGFRGIPRRCPERVDWAGLYDTRDGTHYRVWSCDGHLTGGHTWIERPSHPTARGDRR